MVVENNVCQLLDLENQVVGVPNQLRARVVQHRRINSLEALDVYGFGHALYEMLFQRRLETDTCEDFPADCTPMPSKWRERERIMLHPLMALYSLFPYYVRTCLKKEKKKRLYYIQEWLNKYLVSSVY